MPDGFTFRFTEARGAPTYEKSCHNWRQLITAQLFILRTSSGTPEEAEHTATRETRPGTMAAARVEVASQDMHRARVAVAPRADNEAGDYTAYHFDGRARELRVQDFAADHQPLGDPKVFGSDESGEVALKELHNVLFAFNNLAVDIE